jgi:hypothetical protein
MTAMRAIRHGTEQELADHSAGYVASGESEFSRSAARSGKAREFDGRPARPKNISRQELIAKTTKRIAKLRCDLSLCTSAARRAKLERDVEIKIALLARLRAEQ